LFAAEENTTKVATAGNITRESTSFTEVDAMDWVKNDNRRVLHFVYNVGDLDKTIKYTYLIQQVYI